MQNTFFEFKESTLNKYGECQSCHLASNSMETHSFFGGHDLEKLNSSLFLEMERINKNQVIAKIISNGIPHSFPTGDLFRTLRVSFRDKKTKKYLGDLSLKKDYIDLKSSDDPNSPSMILLADNRISPPINGHSSHAEFVLNISEEFDEIEAEMYMDYLFGLNRLVTKLPDNITLLKFKIVNIRLKSPKDSG